jgi:hypothetical protein
MKDLVKTFIVTGIVLLCLLVAFFIASNLEQGIELLTRTNLPKNDPDVELLYKTLENNSDLRKASLKIKDLTDAEIYKLVIDNIKKDNYSKKTVKAEKIVCQVTKKVFFYTEGKSCEVRTIKTSHFTDYIKKNYNLDREIEFTNFNYGGYDCRLDGKKYYCKYTSTKNYVQGYSVFKEAYKTKDNLVISEYYVQVDLSDPNRCSIYFDEEYCANYKEMKREEISEKKIKKDGVLYEHVFTLVDDKYYLEESYVKNEG